MSNQVVSKASESFDTTCGAGVVLTAAADPAPTFRMFSQSTLVMCCVLALWGLIAFYYTTFFIYSVKCPFSIDYEGHVAWACDRLAHFQNIYDAAMLSEQPFAISMYNPLFMVIGAIAFKANAIDLGLLRCISFLGTIYCFLGLFNILHKRCKLDTASSALGTGMFACYMSVAYWSHLARVDMLGLAFAIWGIERFALAIELRNCARDCSSSDASLEGESETASFVCSMLLLLCAFFTKQQYFIFPIAAVLFCIFQGQKKLGLKFLAVYLCSATLIGALIQTATGGYFAHLTYASGLQWQWETLATSLIPFLCDPKTVAIGVILGACLLIRARETPFEKLAIIIAAISLPLAFYTMGLEGAYHNHLLSLEFAICWLLAASIARFSTKILIFTLGLALFSTVTLVEHTCDFLHRLEALEANPPMIEALQAIKLEGKSVLFEDATVATVLKAKPDFVDVTTLFNTTGGAAQKIELVCRSLEKKQYAAIMINLRDDSFHELIWPASVIRCIKRNYKQLGSFTANGEEQVLYVPR